jgi:multidrug efflux pump subunit AcrB
VSLRTPLGSSIDYTDAKLREVEAILDTPEIRSEFSLIGLGAAGQVNQGTVVVRMAPRGERLKQQDVIPMLRQEFRIAGARVFAAPYPMVQGARGEPLQFVLTGTNLQELGQHAQALQRKLAALPGSAASTPTCSSTCPSSSSAPTACASPTPASPPRTWPSPSTCSPAGSTSPSSTTSPATASATTSA